LLLFNDRFYNLTYSTSIVHHDLLAVSLIEHRPLASSVVGFYLVSFCQSYHKFKMVISSYVQSN